MEGTSRELITESIANTNERVNPAHRSARKPERGTRPSIHTARKTRRVSPDNCDIIFSYFLLYILYSPNATISLFGTRQFSMTVMPNYPLIVPDLGLREKRPGTTSWSESFLFRGFFTNNLNSPLLRFPVPTARPASAP